MKLSNKILKLALADLLITVKSIYVKIFFLLATVYSVMLLYVKPNLTPVYYAKSNYMVLLVLLVLSGAFILGRDFIYNTYSYVFSGVYSKSEIIISKVFSMMGFGFVIWLFQLFQTFIFFIVLSVANKYIQTDGIIISELLNMLTFYVVLSALIGSFLILVTTISLNVLTPVLWGISVFVLLNTAAHNFYFLIENQIIAKPKWAYLISLIPQGILVKWNGQLWIKEITILLVYIFLNVTISILIVNKRQLLKKD